MWSDDDFLTEGGEKYIDSGWVVVDDPVVHAVEVLLCELEHGLFLRVLLGGAGAGAEQTLDLCFCGNDLLLRFGLGVDTAFVAFLHTLAEGLLGFDLFVETFRGDGGEGIVFVVLQCEHEQGLPVSIRVYSFQIKANR